jgi:EAL domain-containing protein (putative c-di-GMP-specific phosphodiesterase class I)
MNMDIDLPVHQFRKEDRISCLREAIAHHDIKAKQLTFEITESAAMDDVENTMKVFQYLTRIGVMLSIDDSETGYSSLSYVRPAAHHGT